VQIDALFSNPGPPTVLCGGEVSLRIEPGAAAVFWESVELAPAIGGGCSVLDVRQSGSIPAPSPCCETQFDVRFPAFTVRVLLQRDWTAN
jgi:hypothetical protein